jgi:urea transport system permease protein
MTRSFFARNPSALIFIACLAAFTLVVTIASEAYGVGFLSTSFVKTLGKTLCLCLVALAMDLIWGYAGILSLGHMAFFALGGYMIGMWLMYARTEEIVVTALAQGGLPATPEEVTQGIATQIFGVVGSSDLPVIWSFAHSLPLQLILALAVPGLLALIFGWLAFRSRVTGVYLSRPLPLPERQRIARQQRAFRLAEFAWPWRYLAGLGVDMVLLGLRARPWTWLPDA